jgi:hypothetical protein
VYTLLNNHLGIDDEQGTAVWICQNLRLNWAAIWPSQRHFT